MKKTYKIDAGQWNGVLDATGNRAGHDSVRSALQALVPFAIGVNCSRDFITVETPDDDTLVYLGQEDADRDDTGERAWATVHEEP